jgi:hypothetical protein
MLSLAIREECTERRDASLVSRSSNTIHDDMGLESGLLIINGVATQRSNHLRSVLVTILGQQPTGRLGKPDHAKEHNECKHALESDWEAPRKLIRAIGAPVIDPIGDQSSKSNNSALNTNEQTMVLGSGALGLVRWDGRRVHSIAHSRDNSPDDELCRSVMPFKRSYLDHSAKNHDASANNDAFSATQGVTENQHCYRTKQACPCQRMRYENSLSRGYLHPISYIAVTKPCQVELWYVSGK